MDGRDLHGLIDQVKAGRLSRRGFVRRMMAVGLSAPIATQLLALGGVAMAEGRPIYKPTKRGGGGLLKVLWWQARPCSIRTSRPGPRTRTARACSTSRSPAGTRMATC